MVAFGSKDRTRTPQEGVRARNDTTLMQQRVSGMAFTGATGKAHTYQGFLRALIRRRATSMLTFVSRRFQRACVPQSAFCTVSEGQRRTPGCTSEETPLGSAFLGTTKPADGRRTVSVAA